MEIYPPRLQPETVPGGPATPEVPLNVHALGAEEGDPPADLSRQMNKGKGPVKQDETAGHAGVPKLGGVETTEGGWVTGA